MNLKWKLYLEFSECWNAARVCWYTMDTKEVKRKLKENKLSCWHYKINE